MTEQTLRRSITLWHLSAYGIGAILGAGIYVLIGEVIALSGSMASLAFACAGIVALLTGISYARLSSRFPQSAGVANYLQQAFPGTGLSTAGGLLVAVTGIVSMATLSNGFVGYFQLFFDWPAALISLLLLSSLTLIALSGIQLSILFITTITILEVAGLLFIIALGAEHIPQQVQQVWQQSQQLQFASASTILLGAFLAFYAFIGFEDMVNVAEEVIEPETNMAKGILIAILFTSLIYILVCLACQALLPDQQLAGSKAPLALIAESRGYHPAWISLISLIAIINGALVQLIMVSRLLYGMAKMQKLPAALALISRRRTPWLSTLFTFACGVLLAIFFSLGQLAATTSYIILVIFSLVNAALLKLCWQRQVILGKFASLCALLALLSCLGLLCGKVFLQINP